MKCPRCQIEDLIEVQAMNALSRSDNLTYICSPCGEDEAFLDFIKIGHVTESWPISRIRENGHFDLRNIMQMRKLVEEFADEK